MCTSAGDWCRGKLPSLRSGDGISSFLICLDLVVYFDAGLNKFIEYVSEGNLVQ